MVYLYSYIEQYFNNTNLLREKQAHVFNSILKPNEIFLIGILLIIPSVSTPVGDTL